MQIEKGIPIPTKQYTRNCWTFLNDMEVGDSVLLDLKSYGSARQSVHIYARVNQKEFIVRKLPEGVRIWRTS